MQLGWPTGVSTGSPTISATLSGVTGSTVLTVQASPASLTITTTSLPDARVGFVYSSAPQLQATGGDEAVCMVVQPAQPDEPVASSPGFIIEPGHWSDQRDADIGGIDGCSIPLYGEGERFGHPHPGHSHQGVQYQGSKSVILYLLQTSAMKSRTS